MGPTPLECSASLSATKSMTHWSKFTVVHAPVKHQIFSKQAHHDNRSSAARQRWRSQMPLPILAIAVPVLHSSGAWIAATAGSGYIAGTLSSTWIGAFVLGNSGLLSSLGFVSAAGILAASGGLTAFATGAAASAGAALSSVGLVGVATALGLPVPAATFLGLTLFGWAFVAIGAISGPLLYLLFRRTMSRLNAERQRGGLEPITAAQIFKEIRRHEAASLKSVLSKLESENSGVSLSPDREKFSVNGKPFFTKRLRYVINTDGSEDIVLLRWFGRPQRIFMVKTAPAKSKATGTVVPG